MATDPEFPAPSSRERACGSAEGRTRTIGISPPQAMESLLARPFPAWKRLMDITGALAAVIILSPLMLVIAIFIRITSRGPVIFRQTRIGYGGKPFIFYKFRSMYRDAEERKKELIALNERDWPAFKMKNDPRVTPLGRILRRWSLDELPQFFNVIAGDMSLVGPRPHLPEESDTYRTWQERRLEVKPGITCLWQISARHMSSFDDWVRLDIEYIDHYSLPLDLKILLFTIPAVLSRRGAS